MNKHEHLINHWMDGSYLKQAARFLLQTLHPGPRRDPLACVQDYLNTYGITTKFVKLQAIMRAILNVIISYKTTISCCFMFTMNQILTGR